MKQKPIEIVPITSIWFDLTIELEKEIKDRENISLPNVDLTSVLSFLNINELLTKEQLLALEKIIDKNVTKKMENPDFEDWYTHSLMNIFFDVCSRPKHKPHILSDGIDTLCNYLIVNELISNEQMLNVTDQIAENVYKIKNQEIASTYNKVDC